MRTPFRIFFGEAWFEIVICIIIVDSVGLSIKICAVFLCTSNFLEIVSQSFLRPVPKLVKRV